MKLSLFAMNLVVALGLGACANISSGDAPSQGPDMTTDSDEAPARRRARTRLELAINYFDQGQTRVALDEIKQSLTQDPAYAEALNLRGLIYMRLTDMRLAEDSFKQSLAINPRDGNTLHNFAWLVCQMGRYPEAAASFTKAMANPNYRDSAKTLMAQGICELRAGKTSDAERSFTRSYELDPGNPVSGYNLSNLLYKRGELVRSQFHVRRLNNSEFANSESLWLGIKIERKMQNPEGMRQLGEQLRKRFAQSVELQLYEKGSFDE
jgi:type IV pilus assembly protein PilF